ncbi:ezrin isoform X1 [Chlorella sorokiniana]|uniref:Ezrin isoform X1 n=1 Tax=Chlorella sorokiniana TaxID=3076 RepID=A0A2P6U310_CHLSO|nr:ezrin isoform X1 [Chlorella sorokiniana]|eukprot:PRW60698.1 ezrin isoform X1 [Chlorella sorokiniana]
MICLSTTLLPPEAGAVEQAGVVEHAAVAVMGAAATTMTAMAAGLEGWAAGVQHSLRVCDFHCQAVETATLAIFTMVATKWLLVNCGLDSPASPQSDSERMIATAIAAARKAEADDSAQQVASRVQLNAQLASEQAEEPVAEEAQSSKED